MIDGKIYKITNLLNNKSYIGQTIVALKKRWKQHCSKDRNNMAIKRAIHKYGESFFKIEIIDTASTYEELNKKEAHYIDELNTVSPNGYNLRLGGNQSSPSLESRKKMSESQKLLAKKRLHPGSKSVICIETGKIWANAKIAAKENNIQYSTLKSKLQGMNANDTTLRYECNKDLFKKPTGYCGGNNSQAKTVVCTKTGKIWSCAKEAAVELEVSITTLRSKLNGDSRNNTSLKYKDSSNKIDKNIKPQKKPVICLKTGKTWPSIREAANELNIKSHLCKKLNGSVRNDTTLRYKDHPDVTNHDIKPLKKPVVCLNTGKTWSCIKDAADELGIKPNTLRGKLSGDRKNNTTLIYLKDINNE